MPGEFSGDSTRRASDRSGNERSHNGPSQRPLDVTRHLASRADRQNSTEQTSTADSVTPSENRPSQRERLTGTNGGQLRDQIRNLQRSPIDINEFRRSYNEYLEHRFSASYETYAQNSTEQTPSADNVIHNHERQLQQLIRSQMEERQRRAAIRNQMIEEQRQLYEARAALIPSLTPSLREELIRRAARSNSTEQTSTADNVTHNPERQRHEAIRDRIGRLMGMDDDGQRQHLWQEMKEAEIMAIYVTPKIQEWRRKQLKLIADEEMGMWDEVDNGSRTENDMKTAMDNLRKEYTLQDMQRVLDEVQHRIRQN